MRLKPTIIAAIGIILGALSSCSPLYVARAGYEQAKILWHREPITELLRGSTVTADEREKLSAVLDARAFAGTIGLTPGDSFTTYTRIERNELAWVLLASKPDSFSLFTWWYPIVGTVPYKGFFEKAAAEKSGRILEEIGYEVWIRPTEAISTLGWFNDPLLSTTLRNEAATVVNTVLHESTHSTIWIPGGVDFNESLANFVGARATIEFFESRRELCADQSCTQRLAALVDRAKAIYNSQLALSEMIEGLYGKLDRLYRSDKPKEQKLAEREAVFEEFLTPVRAKNPKLQAFKQLNNAEIIQFKLYLTGLRGFEGLFAKHSGSWPAFFESIRLIIDRLEHAGSKSAWELLQEASQP
ncbi:MAG: aminopeptidase [Oligoflexia bacterium]|nr:aminopeptidase [Oligoflexia bacterium]